VKFHINSEVGNSNGMNQAGYCPEAVGAVCSLRDGEPGPRAIVVPDMSAPTCSPKGC